LSWQRSHQPFSEASLHFIVSVCPEKRTLSREFSDALHLIAHRVGYTFEGKPHDYLPDVVGKLSDGKLFIAEAGMEDDKRRDRNLAKAEAARRLARLQRGRYWIGTEKLLTQQRHYNLVFLHARRQSFPNFADIALAIQRIWPWGEVASVEEVESRL
jgi:hypothetical protein